MADYAVPTDQERAEWEAWVAERPPALQELARKFTPWSLWLLKSSGHRVVPYSFDEHADGSYTLRVNVLAMFNSITFERRVFGIAPDDLEACELPGPEEELGATLTGAEEIDAYCASVREAKKRGEPYDFR